MFRPASSTPLTNTIPTYPLLHCFYYSLLTHNLLSHYSDVLESQVRRLQPCLHLYGHTHIPVGEYVWCG